MKPGTPLGSSHFGSDWDSGSGPVLWLVCVALQLTIVVSFAAPEVHWEMVTSQAPWTARAGHTCVVHQGKVWVLGGSEFVSGGSAERNDVWSSPDGMIWSPITASAPWSPRSDHGSAAFSDRIWVLGGHAFDRRGGGHVYCNDVWSSSNGVAWTKASTAAPWVGRAHHSVVVYRDRMWVIGGENSSGENQLCDVWSSNDGEHWTEVTGSAPWGRRSYQAATVHENRIWILGGICSTSNEEIVKSGEVARYRSDVWCSADGGSWTRVVTNAGWAPRQAATAVSWRGRLYLLGGAVSSTSSGPQNDVWTSSDGIMWTQVVTGAAWPRRAEHTAIVFADSILLFGGGNYRARLSYNDVWRLPSAR